MKSISIFLFLLITLASNAQDNKTSGLNARQFHKYWKVESESPDYKVTFRGDTAEILSPKGLTLWRKEKMSGKVTIEYDACVVVEAEGDRLSDLNCFWAANDPKYPDDLFTRSQWRDGIFKNYNTLNLFYVGYGGNDNSTTRFRRYRGEYYGVADDKVKPLLKEYTDASHLLVPNQWYQIRIRVEKGITTYSVNGEELFRYVLTGDEGDGHFGLRLLQNHVLFTDFKVTTL